MNLSVAPPLLRSARAGYSQQNDQLEKERLREESRKSERLELKQNLIDEDKKKRGEQEKKKELQQKKQLHEEQDGCTDKS